MATKKAIWGGKRLGAGARRKPLALKQARRTVVTLTDEEHRQLTRYAREQGLAIGTAARELVLRALARRS